MNIINVGYDSTNYYLLELENGKLLIDSGFPGTLPKLSAELKRKGIAIIEIKYFLATHYHPDHAGLAQVARVPANDHQRHALLAHLFFGALPSFPSTAATEP